MPIRVLFVCAANAARSQMAEALLRSQGGSEVRRRVELFVTVASARARGRHLRQ